MSWIPHTEADRKAMLETIGAPSLDALFEVIPEALRLKQWDVPRGMSEMNVVKLLDAIAAENKPGDLSFVGGGFYDHYIPSAVDALQGRSEFYTAYTPYQPEASQGTLQAIYEYQSSVCRIMGLEFANASLYDGGTAIFEAATMSIRITRREKVVLHPSINPRYRELLETHVANLGLELVSGDDPTGAACVIVQNPAFTGDVEDFTGLAERCHEAGALLVMSVYPISLGLLKTPGEMGADIAVAEGQCLGMPLGFGGPYLGIMATRKEHVRRMPGRIAGMTTDAVGRRGFVLTLQAREQHIRRSKAMSNICTNQALMALRATIYMTLLGKQGFREVAVACHSKAEYLKKLLDGFAPCINEKPTFNEFTVRLPRPARDVVRLLKAEGIHAGIPMEDCGAGGPNDLLIAVTEKRTRDEIDAFALSLEKAIALKEAACN
jgi:glycine dehydrogenase subunit 1